ncbi:MAG: hypothetical protein ABMA13_20825 [Chthoniobacteraceae bacterium]
MTPNAFTFLARGIGQVRKLGWRLLWHRYVTRRRILDAGSIPCPENADLEVHMQVCARDWLNALWTLRSFRHYAKRPFQLVLLCDRSVTEAIRARLRHRLPGADVIACEQPSSLVRECFAGKFPALYRLRTGGQFFTLPKVMDSFAQRRRDVVLSIDPDVLFFDHPDELLENPDPSATWVARFNAPRNPTDRRGGFAIDEDTLLHSFGLGYPERFGCGLGPVNYARADWDLIERIVSELPPDPERAFLLDQTIFAIWCAKFGWEPLAPARYAIDPVENLDGVVARHYYSKTRDLLYVEGIAELTRRGLLN